jgi:hypothetical protein
LLNAHVRIDPGLQDAFLAASWVPCGQVKLPFP